MRQSCCFTDPAGGDAGFIIMESEYYVPMSGTNTICTATALLETGMVAMREPVTRLTLEAPGGLVPVERNAGTANARA